MLLLRRPPDSDEPLDELEVSRAHRLEREAWSGPSGSLDAAIGLCKLFEKQSSQGVGVPTGGNSAVDRVREELRCTADLRCNDR